MMTEAIAGPMEHVEFESGTAAEDMAFIRDSLSELRQRRGKIRIYRPVPTAAFSRLDSLRRGYARACHLVTDWGFEPVMRPAGGHLAIYDAGSVVVDMIAPHGSEPDPMHRFAAFSGILAKCLQRYGIDAKIAPLPNEFCPGTYSLQAGGRKVVGLAQRLTKHGFHLGAVIMVGSCERPRAAMTAAYRALDLPLDPRTVGSLSDVVPDITPTSVEAEIARQIGSVFPRHGWRPQHHAEGFPP